jgi:F-type H+-transporting ATPase subunit gamma
MANLLDLKRRIKAAGNVSKTTRAMQMIAASKLKKAQERSLSGKPYIDKLSEIAKSISSKLQENKKHEYMKKSAKSNKTLVLAFSPDKGLCGGLNANLARELMRFDEGNKNNLYLTVGKKITSTASGLQKDIIASFDFGNTLPSFDMVFPITKIVDEYYLGEKVRNVKIISTNFLSVFSQKAITTDLLPVKFSEDTPPSSKFFVFEPSAAELLPSLLSHFLEMTIYQNLLECFASQQAAQMMAMQSATDNALEIVQILQLEYNKKRQEKITNEILDIGSATISANN